MAVESIYMDDANIPFDVIQHSSGDRQMKVDFIHLRNVRVGSRIIFGKYDVGERSKLRVIRKKNDILSLSRRERRWQLWRHM